MRIFSPLYEKVMCWVVHRHAQWYLVGLSFTESSFFPIPPDVMLAPMALAQPKRALYLAGITTLASVAGGMFGYLIGVYAFDAITPVLQSAGYWERYLTAQDWFSEWGIYAIFIAGFSPIPYKVFTIAAGALSMAILPFVLASLIGRGLRFYLVALLMMWGGEKMEALLRKYVDILGWLTIIAVIGLYFVLK